MPFLRRARTGASARTRPSSGKRLLLALAASISLLPAQAPPEPEDVFGQIDAITAELREIMGFGPRRPVRAAMIDKPQFRRLFSKLMRTEYKPREIRNEVLFLRLFGLVPRDFNYEKTVLDLMSEQAWALYDYRARRLYIADWAPPEARTFALTHELVHAIDDQQFNLLKYIKRANGAEGQIARMAVLEGQASWVMTEWLMQQSGRSLVDNKLLAITTASATRFEAAQFPVYAETPLYFREVLLFPYTDGLLFQQAMIEEFGQAGLRRVFDEPPRSSQQILQPELYLQGLDPEPPALPALQKPPNFRRVYDGTFGQLDHRILLEHHLNIDDAEDLLDQWRGARFEVYENRRNGAALLRYAARWADSEAANEYYQLYRQICERKWSGLEMVDSGAGRCEGETALGRVVLEVSGDTVRSIEGLPRKNGE